MIYSFKATGDYAPTFISQNIKDLLGYDREEYLESPDFWQSRVHPAGQPAHPAGLFAAVRGGAAQQRVPVPQEGRQLLLGQRRTAGAARRGRRAGRGRRRLERHHRAQAARRGAGRRAGPARASAVLRTGGDLQLQGDRRFRADLRQREHHATGWATSRDEYLENPGFLAAAACIRTISPAVEAAGGAPVPEGPPHGRVPVPQEGRHAIAG